MTAHLTVVLGYDSEAIERAARALAADRCARFPETRRHPRDHGADADFVIGIARHHTIAVATHSDAFVLRVRRRVAEGALAAGDVAILWVDGATVRPIALNDRGTPDWWPAGVFLEAHEEFAAIRRALAARDAGKGAIVEPFRASNPAPAAEIDALARPVTCGVGGEAVTLAELRLLHDTVSAAWVQGGDDRLDELGAKLHGMLDKEAS